MNEHSSTIDELFGDGRATDEAVLEASSDARRLHKALDRPMATRKDGQVAWVQPEDNRGDYPAPVFNSCK